MQVQIVNFIPKDYVSSGVPIREVYSTIGRLTDDSEIIRYLHDIVQYEKQAVELILYSFNTWYDSRQMLSNFILRDFLSTFGINEQSSDQEIKQVLAENISESNMRSIGALCGLLGLDAGYTSNIYENPKIHILTYDGSYIGHVYSWEDILTIGVQGIRTSIRNILDRILGGGYRNVSPILIDSTVKLARLLGFRVVQVHEPYLVMEAVLASYGFDKTWRFRVANSPLINIAEYTLISRV